MGDNPFRNLPSVNEVLELPAIQDLGRSHAHELIVETIRQELAKLRQRLSRGEMLDGYTNGEAVAKCVAERLEREF